MTVALLLPGLLILGGLLVAIPWAIERARHGDGQPVRVQQLPPVPPAGRHRRDTADPNAVTMTGFLRALTAQGDAAQQRMHDRTQQENT